MAVSAAEPGPVAAQLLVFLSTRPDLVSRSALGDLPDPDRCAPAVPWSVLREVVRGDLGTDPDEVFAAVAPEPAESGFFVQKRAARLLDGREVLLTVQVPGAWERLEESLARPDDLLRRMEGLRVSAVADPRVVLGELAGWLRERMDLTRALANLERARACDQDEAGERLPLPLAELSGPRVLTTENLGGSPLREILPAAGAGYGAAPDPVRLGEDLLQTVLRRVYRDRFFPGLVSADEVLALPDGAVGYASFTSWRTLEGGTLPDQLAFVAAAYDEDLAGMRSALAGLLAPGAQSDLNAFSRELRAALEEREGNGSGRRLSRIAWLLLATARTARLHGFLIPPDVLASWHAVAAADSLAERLGCAPSSRKTMVQGVLLRFQIEQALRGSDFASLGGSLVEMLKLARESPARIHQVLSDMTDGTFGIDVHVTESPKTVRAKDRRTRLVVTAILSVSVSLLLTVPDLPAPFGISLAWPLSGLLIALCLAIFVQWRRLS